MISKECRKTAGHYLRGEVSVANIVYSQLLYLQLLSGTNFSNFDGLLYLAGIKFSSLDWRSQ